VRVEHQQTDATTVGLEVAAGRGDAEAGRAWLLAARGYGRTAYTDGGYLAVTWGGGVSILTSGLVTVGGHAGAAASYPDDWATPYLSAGLALAAPLRQGWPRPLPTPTCADCDAASDVRSSDVRADLFVYADLGLVSALGGDAPRLSVDLGVASPVRAYGAGLLSLSVGAGAADR
jgi:hypothetical protein